MRKFLLLTCFWGAAASAQSIQVDELASASPYQAGTLTPSEGGMDSALWQGTSARIAIELLSDMPPVRSDIARTILRSVLLSPGVPPQSDNPQQAAKFQSARLMALVSLGEISAAQSIMTQMPELSTEASLISDLGFITGDFQSACLAVDRVFENRGDTEWLRKRTFCHLVRDEIPAADLTTDLLRSSGHKDPFFYAAAGQLSGVPGKISVKGYDASPLHMALMRESGQAWPKGKTPISVQSEIALSPDAAPADRLAALFAAAPALTDAQMVQVLEALGRTAMSSDASGNTLVDLEAALAADPPQSLGQLFDVARFGQPTDKTKASAEILKRAEAGGAFVRFVSLLKAELASLPAADQLQAAPETFIKAAIARRDLVALQSFHQGLGDIHAKLRDRLALAADALGNGYFGGSFGSDIETRLTATSTAQKRAVRDAMIAFALGANPTDEAVLALSGGSAKRVRLPVDIIALRAAARNQARAETALRSARILSSGTQDLDDFVLGEVLSALQTAGLFDLAGEVAAIDFMAGG